MLQVKWLSFVFIFFPFGATYSYANDAGHGRINMKGAVVETPCAIDVGDRAQVLSLGAFPVSDILIYGQSPWSDFSIRLFGCSLSRGNPAYPDWHYFRVTFDGEQDVSGNFRLSGSASGISMVITDSSGGNVRPKEQMSPVNITPGEMKLNYSVYMVPSRETIRPGTYNASVRFRLDYY